MYLDALILVADDDDMVGSNWLSFPLIFDFFVDRSNNMYRRLQGGYILFWKSVDQYYNYHKMWHLFTSDFI